MDIHCNKHIYNGYNMNNSDIYIESSLSKSPYRALLQELLNFDVKNAEHLSYKHGSNYNSITILHSIYVKDDAREGVGSQYIKNLLLFSEMKMVGAVFLVADLTLNQREGIDLISFYEKHNFEALYQTPKYALMRHTI